MSQTEVQLIKDAVIVNADVSNSAAIDVSKISGALPAAGGTITGDLTFDGETAGRDIVFDRSDNALEFADNAKAIYGAGSDLEVYHSGSANYIDGKTVATELISDDLRLRSKTGNETYINADVNGAVELFYDNDLHFATTADGVKTNGDLSFRGDGDVEQILFDASDASLKFADDKKAKFGTGDDLEIFHNGNHSFITDSGTGNLFVKTSKLAVENAAGNESLLTATQDGAVELYHNGTKKLETSSSGATLSGSLSIDANIIHNGDTDTMLSFSTDNQVDIKCADTVIGKFTTNGLALGDNKRLDILDASGHRSGMINNSDSGANSLRISADPDSSGSNTSIQFHVDGTEQARIENGISFNGDTADANFLNDYEEGTFTPSNTIGMPLTNTHTAQYVKIGNMCWIVMNIIFDSTPADTSQCGLIQNLPFTSANTTSGEQQLPYFFISEGGGTATRDEDEANTVYFIGANESRVDIFSLGGSAIQTRSFLAGRRMRMNFCYRTA